MDKKSGVQFLGKLVGHEFINTDVCDIVGFVFPDKMTCYICLLLIVSVHFEVKLP